MNPSLGSGFSMMPKYVQPAYENLKPRKLKSIVDSIKFLNGGREILGLEMNEVLRLPPEKIKQQKRLLNFITSNYFKLQDDRRNNIYVLEILSDYFRSYNKINSLYRRLFYNIYECLDDPDLANILLQYLPKVSGSMKVFIDGKGKILMDRNVIDLISTDLSDFVMNCIKDGNRYDENEFLYNEYRINTSTIIFQHIIPKYLEKSVSKKYFFDNPDHYQNLLNKVTDDGQFKTIVTKIIEKIPEGHSEESRYKVWVDYIYHKYGAPYSRYHRQNWIGFKEDIKEKFNGFVMLEKIEEFFNRLDSSNRAPFWKLYYRYFRDIEFIEPLNRAVLILTNKSDLFVEFLEIGNALFLYKLKSQEEYNQIVDYVKNPFYGKTALVGYLKGHNRLLRFDNIKHNYSNEKPRLCHIKGPGPWQEWFPQELKRIGYISNGQ